VLNGTAAGRSDLRDCRLHLPDGWEGIVEGRPVSRVPSGRTVPFRPDAGLPGGCRGTVRLLLTGDDLPSAGARIRVPVRWEARGHPVATRPEWAGRLRVLDGWETAPGGDAAGRALVLRGAVQERIATLWGPRAPMVEALVLARREHLDPGLREAFGLSGTAHLLAISGFHVGVVAGILFGFLRMTGASRSRAAALSAAGCWLYVLGIGAPHAGVRAALILTLLAAARIRGMPVMPIGALATAFLALLVMDARYLRSVGFQLSFAGTSGLVLLRGPLGDMVDRAWRHWRGRPLVKGRKTRGPGDGLLKGSADGLVAGTAATLPTLPLLAWHFDRVSLVGIPATLAVAPGVAAAIPGIGASLLLSLLPGGLGAFLAGGVGLLLALVEQGVRWSAALPGASIWVSRPALLGAAAVALPVLVFLRRGFPGRVGPVVRRSAASGAACAAVLLIPLVPTGGALEIHMLDVGQGDAIALRTPSNRWLLVDAGPRSQSFDAGARRVVPYLRRHGVRSLDVMILSHPHLDHVGGAPAVLRDLRVRGVMDPSRAVPSSVWRETLSVARDQGISWWTARSDQAFRVGGVHFEVLHPGPATVEDPTLSDLNDLSIVVLVRHGRGTLLLTGDAGSAIEEAILDALPHISVLKVGHHGSRTSSSAELLDRVRPGAALIPVGDGNHYGHPHVDVKERYVERGIPVYRSDRDGHVRVRLYRDGSMRVQTQY
jgi:competence protein ComEC